MHVLRVLAPRRARQLQDERIALALDQAGECGHDGGVIGEVVSDYAGLHGSALAAQRQYVSEPTLTIAFGRTGFLQKVLKVQAGQPARLVIKNVSGTSGGQIQFESQDLGIPSTSLAPGETQELRWTAPTDLVNLTAKVNKSPNGTLTLVVVAKPAAPPTSEPAPAGAQIVEVNSNTFSFNLAEVTVQAGQPVRFVITNGDDEKHNLVGIGEGLDLLSPDVSAGQKVTYDWTAPSAPGTYTMVCAYHPQMTSSLVVK